MSTKLYNVLKDLKKEDILKRAKYICEHGHNGLSHPQCYVNNIQGGERIGILDIECSGLKASFAKILSYCIKEYDGPIIGRALTTQEVRGKEKDSTLIKELVTDMGKFDRLVTFYGSRFDIPFIRTRAVHFGIDFPSFGEIVHTDIYDIIKHKFKLHRSSLEASCEFFDIPAKGHRLSPEIWDDCTIGEKKALEYVLEHNKEDVISTELLFKRVMPYTKIKKTSI